MSTQPTSLLEHRPSAEMGSDLEPILRALGGLVASAEPAVVFTDLTRLCVPLLCDAATATVLTADQQAYQTKWPWNAAEPEDFALVGKAMAGRQVISHNAVLTPIVGRSAEGIIDYQGVLALNFHTSSPSPSHGVLAQLVVERAVAVIERERLADVVTAQQVQVDNLRIALASNREIGAAVGILMASRKLTSEHAFDLLRRVSQHSHRKLRELALEVIDTGTIELPPSVTRTASPASPAKATAAGQPGPRSSTPCTPRH
jgi:ANTAR domain